MARILAVCDAFSAMTTTRPYRKALSVDEALTRLEDACGSQLDERLVIAFVAGIRTVATAPLPGDERSGLWTPAPIRRGDRPCGRLTCPPHGACERRRVAAWSIPVAVLVAALVLPAIGLAAAPPALGTADNYAIVANTTITNTGVTLIDGNLALVGPSATGMGGRRHRQERHRQCGGGPRRGRRSERASRRDRCGARHGDVGRRSRRPDPRPRRLSLRVLGRAARNAHARRSGRRPTRRSSSRSARR